MDTPRDLPCHGTQQNQAAPAGTLLDGTHTQAVSDSIWKYITHHHLDPASKHVAIGTFFDLEKLKGFIAAIDAYNASFVPPDQKIDSLRIYKTREAYEIPGTGVTQEVDGVVLVPAKADGSDAFKVFQPQNLVPATQPLVMLANGTPCPNLCNQSIHTGGA